MIYQVRANILFNEEDEALDFYHDCELALAKGVIINPDSDNLEYSHINMLLSNHEQDPNQPSELIKEAQNL